MREISSIAMPAWAAALKAVSYKCRTCQRSLVLRQSSSRKAGIRMRGAWYCSSACFISGAEQELSELLKSGVEQSNHVSRMPLGLILMSKGLLTCAQLREVTDEQKELGGEIGDLLVQRGSVSERQVAAVRATQWGCPVFAMPKHTLRTIIHVPVTLIRLYSAVPLHYVAATKLLLVGFVHGIEYSLLYAIEQMTGCKTQPCFVTPSDFVAQLQRQVEEMATGDVASPNEVEVDTAHTGAEMATILCSYGVDLEADEVLLGKCKEYLWARFLCGARSVDLLFKTG
jgi:hypothetical protein